MFDFHNEFFRPVWIRIVIVAICLGWSVFEFATGAVFWGILFNALGIWAAWAFYNFPDAPD